jgi:hypothetical protein
MNTSTTQSSLFGAGVCFIAALLVLIGGVIFSANNLKLVISGNKTDGIVTTVHEDRSRTSTWSANISYVAQDGNKYSGMVTSLVSLDVGEKVTIFYNSKNPSQIQISNLSSLFISPALFFILFLMFLFSGIRWLPKSKNQINPV